jgi:hypothetical protein
LLLHDGQSQFVSSLHYALLADEVSVPYHFKYHLLSGLALSQHMPNLVTGFLRSCLKPCANECGFDAIPIIWH